MLLLELNLVAYLQISLSVKKILNYILHIKSFDLNCNGKSSLQSHLIPLDTAIVKIIVGWMKYRI